MKSIALPRALLALTACAALAACAAEVPSPKQQPPKELATPTAPGESTFDARWPVLEGYEIDRSHRLGGVRVTISEDLHRRCDLSDMYFDFDKVDPHDEDKTELKRVSECFTRGPLWDRRLLVIGRADRSGDPYYNMALGKRRAERVKKLFVSAGIDPGRITVVSQGAKSVIAGSSEGYTDADDRRVDISLAP